MATRSCWTFVLLLLLTANVPFRRTSATEMRMTDAIQRHIRALSYPEESEMGLFFALAIPLDDPVSTKAISVAFFFEANYELPTSFDPKDHANRGFAGRRKRLSIDRKTVYTMLESKFQSIGFPGRQCLLRSICETARQPIHRHNGLLGDLLRIILTPSTSAFENLHPIYTAAEDHNTTMDCGKIYSGCTLDIYQHISRQF